MEIESCEWRVVGNSKLLTPYSRNQFLILIFPFLFHSAIRIPNSAFCTRGSCRHERLLPKAKRSSSHALGVTLLKTRRVGLFLFRIPHFLFFLYSIPHSESRIPHFIYPPAAGGKINTSSPSERRVEGSAWRPFTNTLFSKSAGIPSFSRSWPTVVPEPGSRSNFSWPVGEYLFR